MDFKSSLNQTNFLSKNNSCVNTYKNKDAILGPKKGMTVFTPDKKI
jgi:hypothetical protein